MSTASNNQPPAHFCCPITQSLMEDPVIAPDGSTYERAALVRWAASCGHTPPTLPTTGLPFDLDALIPNRSLKDAIDEWRHGAGAGVSAATRPSVDSAVPIPPLPPVATVNILRTRYYASADGSAVVSVPPVTGPQRSLHVVAVIDVSGSMGVPATMNDESGAKEETMYTVLDIVKYAAKAVANMLGPNDSFSVITFCETAKVLLSRQPTRNATDLKVIETALERLQPGGSTNLGDGLRCALQLIADTVKPEDVLDKKTLNAVMLLTDGEPNSGPVALDVLGSFRRSGKVVNGVPSARILRTSGTKEAAGELGLTMGELISQHTVINTFAFGYARSMASSLVFDVASLGNGIYGYIPDITFLGTQFIHCLANLRAVAAVSTTALGLEMPDRVGLWASQYGAVGYSSKRPDGEDSRVGAALDTIDFSKEFGDGVSADNDNNSACPDETVAQIKAQLKSVKAHFTAADILIHLLRGPITTCKYDVNGERTDSGKEQYPTVPTEEAAKAAFAALVAELTAANSSDPSAAYCTPLIEDINSQVTLAFRPEYFRKWGQHYLYGWLSAQQHRMCNNFKDKSLQLLKTAFVDTIVKSYDDIFNMMEPPKPSEGLAEDPLPQSRSRAVYQSNSCSGAGASSSSPLAMAMHVDNNRGRSTIASWSRVNRSSNPCVHEDTRIVMADGTLKAAKYLRSGDAVATLGLMAGDDRTQTTRCVIDHIIRTECEGGAAQFICFPSGFPHRQQADEDRGDNADNDDGDDVDAGAAQPSCGLRITPWHPVVVPHTCLSSSAAAAASSGLTWALPCDTTSPAEVHRCAHVYSFTLAGADGAPGFTPLALIAEGGVPFVYLGHGISPKSFAEGSGIANSSLLSHEFFGTKRVTEALEADGMGKHHTFAHAPVIKRDCGDGRGEVAVAWDMSKYLGGW